MPSLYDEITSVLSADNAFSIPDVTIREPYDESPKTYPLIVVHELNNVPKSITVAGEKRTVLSYQLDIQTQTCADDTGEVLSRFRAGRRLADEVGELLNASFKVTRRSITRLNPSVDVLSTVWRGDVVLDSYGYAYRP
jgi:hypothetical protein